MEMTKKDNQKFSGLQKTRRGCRQRRGRLSWVEEHMQITKVFDVNRVPFPEKGEHVGRHGRKAMGQRWALIAGLPKE
jgi:hypothetical protein